MCVSSSSFRLSYFLFGQRLVSSRDHSEMDGFDTAVVYLATVEDTFTKREGERG